MGQKTPDSKNSKASKKGRKKKADRNSTLFISISLLIVVIISLVAILLILPKPSEKVKTNKESETSAEGAVEEDIPAASDKPETDAGKKKETLVKNTAAKKKPAGVLYLVLDDAGYSIEYAKRYIDLSFPFTIAVLPQQIYSREVAEMSHKAGKEVILHLPMEPIGKEDPGKGAIYTNLDETEIKKRLSKNLKSVPYVKGINNHMGSKATADKKVMENIMQFAGKRKLYFLDSLTTSHSVVAEAAEIFNVVNDKRSVFLDNIDTIEDIREAIFQGARIANTKGYAIMIGHVWSNELVHVLKDVYPLLENQGYDFRVLSEVFEE